MSDGVTVFIVIPALNEAATIGSVLTSLEDHADRVVVVDDGSTDGTGAIAADHGAIVIEHESTKGYDVAIADGFDRAVNLGADIAITFDADGQHAAEDIQNVVEPISSGRADIVVGSRPVRPRIAEQVWTLYGKHRLGITDPLSGFKAYDVQVYRDIGYFDRYNSIGTHLLISAVKRGYSVEEVPISVRERADEPRFGNLRANLTIFRAFGQMLLFDVRTALIAKPSA